MVAVSKIVKKKDPPEVILKRWRDELKNCLLVSPRGMCSRKVESSLVELTGKPVPLADMGKGYKTFLDFLRDCKDIFQVGVLPYENPTHPYTRKFMFLRKDAADSDTENLQKLVDGQEKGKTKKRKDGQIHEPTRTQVRMVDSNCLFVVPIPRQGGFGVGPLMNGYNSNFNNVATRQPPRPVYRGASSTSYQTKPSYNGNVTRSYSTQGYQALNTRGSASSFSPAPKPSSSGWKFPGVGGGSNPVVSSPLPIKCSVPLPLRPLPPGLDDDDDFVGDDDDEMGFEYYSGGSKSKISKYSNGLSSGQAGDSSKTVRRLNIGSLPEKENMWMGQSVPKQNGYDTVDASERRPPRILPQANNVAVSQVVNSSERVRRLDLGSLPNKEIEMKHEAISDQNGMRRTDSISSQLGKLKVTADAIPVSIPVLQESTSIKEVLPAPLVIKLEPKDLGPRPQQIPVKGQLWQIVAVAMSKELKSDFVFRKKTDHDSFIVLEQKLANFYNSAAGQQMTVKEFPTLGFYAGQCALTKKWFRVEVRALPEQKASSGLPIVLGYCFDYGHFTAFEMECGDLRYLSEEFSSVVRTGYYAKVVNFPAPDIDTLDKKADPAPIQITCEGFVKDLKTSTPIVYVRF